MTLLEMIRSEAFVSRPPAEIAKDLRALMHDRNDEEIMATLMRGCGIVVREFERRGNSRVAVLVVEGQPR